MRRARDIVIAGFGLVVVAPLLLGCGLAILLLDGHPVLFIQNRSGLGGRPFRLVKFRTMTPDTAHLPDAHRITGLGRILRATRADELPQLWNVLRGDMSLVGPRPLLPVTITDAGDRGLLRGGVRPGLTGWAQVNGNALLTDADKLALDRWYVENRTTGLDWRIIGRTIGMLLFGERIDPLAIGRAHARGPDRRG